MCSPISTPFTPLFVRLRAMHFTALELHSLRGSRRPVTDFRQPGDVAYICYGVDYLRQPIFEGKILFDIWAFDSDSNEDTPSRLAAIETVATEARDLGYTTRIFKHMGVTLLEMDVNEHVQAWCEQMIEGD
jgi:hypothetical protein